MYSNTAECSSSLDGQRRHERAVPVNMETGSEVIGAKWPSLFGTSRLLARAGTGGRTARVAVFGTWYRENGGELPAAKVAKLAEPRTEAVAPVMIRDGGYFDSPTEASSNGSVACAKLNRPSLVLRVSSSSRG